MAPPKARTSTLAMKKCPSLSTAIAQQESRAKAERQRVNLVDNRRVLQKMASFHGAFEESIYEVPAVVAEAPPPQAAAAMSSTAAPKRRGGPKIVDSRVPKQQGPSGDLVAATAPAPARAAAITQATSVAMPVAPAATAHPPGTGGASVGAVAPEARASVTPQATAPPPASSRDARPRQQGAAVQRAVSRCSLVSAEEFEDRYTGGYLEEEQGAPTQATSTSSWVPASSRREGPRQTTHLPLEGRRGSNTGSNAGSHASQERASPNPPRRTIGAPTGGGGGRSAPRLVYDVNAAPGANLDAELASPASSRGGSKQHAQPLATFGSGQELPSPASSRGGSKQQPVATFGSGQELPSPASSRGGSKLQPMALSQQPVAEDTDTYELPGQSSLTPPQQRSQHLDVCPAVRKTHSANSSTRSSRSEIRYTPAQKRPSGKVDAAHSPASLSTAEAWSPVTLGEASPGSGGATFAHSFSPPSRSAAAHRTPAIDSPGISPDDFSKLSRSADKARLGGHYEYIVGMFPEELPTLEAMRQQRSAQEANDQTLASGLMGHRDTSGRQGCSAFTDRAGRLREGFGAKDAIFPPEADSKPAGADAPVDMKASRPAGVKSACMQIAKQTRCISERQLLRGKAVEVLDSSAVLKAMEHPEANATPRVDRAWLKSLGGKMKAQGAGAGDARCMPHRDASPEAVVSAGRFNEEMVSEISQKRCLGRQQWQGSSASPHRERSGVALALTSPREGDPPLASGLSSTKRAAGSCRENAGKGPSKEAHERSKHANQEIFRYEEAPMKHRSKSVPPKLGQDHAGVPSDHVERLERWGNEKPLDASSKFVWGRKNSSHGISFVTDHASQNFHAQCQQAHRKVNEKGFRRLCDYARQGSGDSQHLAQTFSQRQRSTSPEAFGWTA